MYNIYIFHACVCPSLEQFQPTAFHSCQSHLLSQQITIQEMCSTHQDEFVRLISMCILQDLEKWRNELSYM